MFFNSPLWVGFVLAALLAGLVIFKIRPMLVFALTSAILFLTGTVSQDVFFNGFVNSALVTLLLLIMCSFAIEKTTYIKSFGQPRAVSSDMIVPPIVRWDSVLYFAEWQTVDWD